MKFSEGETTPESPVTRRKNAPCKIIESQNPSPDHHTKSNRSVTRILTVVSPSDFPRL